MNDFRTAVVPIVCAGRAQRRAAVVPRQPRPARTPGRLAGARGYVSMGHDEYWTPAMRDTVQRGARRRHQPGLPGRQHHVLAGAAGRPRDGAASPDDRLPRRRRTRTRCATTRPARRPPGSATRPRHGPRTTLTGMLYECYPVDADYRIATPALVGLPGDRRPAGNRDPRPGRRRVRPRLPRRADPAPAAGPQPHRVRLPRRRHVEPVGLLHDVRSGAGVFTAGTLRWGCALVDRCDRAAGRRTRDFARR